MFIHPQEQYLTYRGLSIHFNIFQWPNEQMDIFFSHVSLWGILHKDKHIEANNYLQTSSEDARGSDYSWPPPLPHL